MTAVPFTPLCGCGKQTTRAGRLPLHVYRCFVPVTRYPRKLRPVRSRHPLRDVSSVAAPPGTSGLPARPLDSTPRSSGSVDPATPTSRRRRLAHGANRNGSSCCRPRSRHNRFLQRSPSLSATACSWFIIRVRACTGRRRCQSSCCRSRFSQLGTRGALSPELRNRNYAVPARLELAASADWLRCPLLLLNSRPEKKQNGPRLLHPRPSLTRPCF
jgi:hypothetical protein